MKAGIIFTGTGPILILTSYSALDDPAFAEKLSHKGIHKYIAFEVDLETVRKKYGQRFEVIINNVQQDDDLRILDYNGQNVFCNFTFTGEMAGPIISE